MILHFLCIKQQFNNELLIKSIEFIFVRNKFLIGMWKLSLFVVLICLGNCIDWSPLNELINEAITEHAFPGVSVSVANDKQVLFRGNYGYLTYKHEVWQLPVNNNTKYDADALTKVMATGLNIMNLLSSNSIQLTDLVSKYIENYDTNKKGNTTIANLLLHSAGLPTDYVGTLPNTQQQFLQNLKFIKPVYPVGTAQLYSNLGYYLLAKIIQKVTKKSFNQYFLQNRVFAGITNTLFNPGQTDFANTAPTQFDTDLRKKIIRGQTQDKLAFKYGGIAGHSGLFTTADDLTKFMRIMLNKGKLPQVTGRVLPEAVVDKFITKVQGLPFQNSRTYIFDTACPGTKMINCFRHDSSTGFLAVADKTRNIVITIVSNRIHPDANNNKFQVYKGKIADTIMSILGY